MVKFTAEELYRIYYKQYVPDVAHVDHPTVVRYNEKGKAKANLGELGATEKGKQTLEIGSKLLRKREREEERIVIDPIQTEDQMSSNGAPGCSHVTRGKGSDEVNRESSRATSPLLESCSKGDAAAKCLKTH